MTWEERGVTKPPTCDHTLPAPAASRQPSGHPCSPISALKSTMGAYRRQEAPFFATGARQQYLAEWLRTSLRVTWF